MIKSKYGYNLPRPWNATWSLKYLHQAPEATQCMSWWRHQMETFSTLLAICAGNSPVTGDSQRPVTLKFHVFFDLCLNKRLSNELRRRWLETPSRSLWRHGNVFVLRILVLRQPIHSKSEMGLPCWVILQTDKLPPSSLVGFPTPGPRLNINTVLSTYGDFHVKDKTAVRTSYL